MITNEELMNLAVESKNKALPTYSNFHVGAALETKDGKIYYGANIENSSYSLTICAERTAAFTALINGERHFSKIAIASDAEDFISPCGACRQVLADLCGRDLEVLMSNKKGEIRSMKIDELLPYSFGEEYLKP